MDLSDAVNDIFLTQDTEKLEENCKGFCKSVESKDIKLVSLVEALGPQLTNTDVLTRVKAVEILSHVFAGLSSDFLLEQELNFIVAFLIDRLKDQNIVIPKVISCIHAVVQSKNLPPDAPKKLLYQLFKEANIQSHPHKIRRAFFLIIRHLLFNKLEDVKEMSSDFVINFIQAIQGEKDPRNLMVLFNFIPIILSHFPLEPFTEDFFEVLSCYFPIDFSPSVNIPGVEVITRDELAQSLHTCLSHTNQFSSFLVPLALEKLESSLVDAKLDSLNLLEMCCEKSYQPKDLEPYLGQIWHNLRREIFLGGNEIVEKNCVKFLKEAFKMISNNEMILDHCLIMIFTECNHHLCEPELRLIHPTSRILVGMAESNEIACKAVLQRTLPVLHEQLSVKATASERKTILAIMGVLITTARNFNEVRFAVLLPKWDEMLAMWFTLLSQNDSQFVSLSLKLFIPVLPIDVDFTKNNRDILQEHLISLLKKENLKQDARSAVISTMDEFSRHYPKEFFDITVSKLIDELKAEDTSIITEKTSNVNILAALAECCPNDEAVTEKVVTFLLDMLEKYPYSLTALSSLARVVEKGCCKEQKRNSAVSISQFIDLVCFKLRTLEKIVDLSITSYRDTEIETLPKRCKNSQVSEEMKDNEKGDCKLTSTTSGNNIPYTLETNEPFGNFLEVSTSIVRNLVKASDVDVQKKLVKTFWGKVETDGLHGVLKNINILLLESLLCPLRPMIEIALKSELMEYLFTLILSSGADILSSKFSQLAAAQRLYSVLLNKMEPEETFQRICENISLSLCIELGFKETENDIDERETSILDQASTTDESIKNVFVAASAGVQMPFRRSKNKNTVNLLVWIVKALAMRGIEDLDAWVTKMVTLLGDKEIGADVAEGFGVIMSDCELSLNAQCYCKYRFLYKQRLFLMTVPKLVLSHRNSSSETAKANYIRALSSQLKHVPKPVLFMEIDNVFPLLVASLSCESSSKVVLLSTLTAFFELMKSEDSKDKLKEYFHDVTPRLLHLSRFKDSMQVRKLAVNCLYTCANFPTHVVLPLKSTVVDELKYCLDDPKRLVRKEAALTRNKWILIGEVGGK